MANDPCKNSTQVVTFDLSDPERLKKHLANSALVMALLFQICDNPHEAYIVVDQVLKTIAKTYDIAGVQDAYMPTQMKQ